MRWLVYCDYMRRILFVVAITLGVLVDGVVLTNVSVHVFSRPYLYQRAALAPHAEAAIIPGAPVFPDGMLTSIFQDRVDGAISLYRAGKVRRILVSGDNSSVSHNEVNPVQRYLLAKGIPPQVIFLDHAGFDTYSTMYRARAIFGVTSAIITTQSFHAPRAVFIARGLGIDAYALTTDSGHILLRNYVREVFADEKAVLNLFFERLPKFLGPTIPITGDGSTSH